MLGFGIFGPNHEAPPFNNICIIADVVTMKIFNGKKEAAKLDEKMKVYLSQGRHDKVLAIVQIGENPVSDLFIKLKTGLCKKFAIAYKVYRINANLTDSDISKEVKNIVDDKKVGGAIIQLPLPRENLNFLFNLIPLEKDMDFLSNKSLAQLKENKTKTVPPAVRALDHFLLVNNIKSQFKGYYIRCGKTGW